jgi:hypothetical protein
VFASRFNGTAPVGYNGDHRPKGAAMPVIKRKPREQTIAREFDRLSKQFDKLTTSFESLKSAVLASPAKKSRKKKPPTRKLPSLAEQNRMDAEVARKGRAAWLSGKTKTITHEELKQKLGL